MSTSTENPGKRLYKSTVPSQTIIRSDGVPIHFRYHQHITDVAKTISFLDSEIEANGFNGAIFIDPAMRTVTPEQENPLLALKKKHFEEFQAAEAARKLNPNSDMGTTKVTPLNPTSSTHIAPTAAGGDASSHLRAAVALRKT